MAVPVRSPGLALWIPSRGPSSVMALRAALGLDIRTPQSRPAAACRTILLCQIVQAQAQLQEHLNEQDKCTCSQYSYASGTRLVRYPGGSGEGTRPRGLRAITGAHRLPPERDRVPVRWPLGRCRASSCATRHLERYQSGKVNGSGLQRHASL
jgi:hypothetical protein